MTGNPPPFSDTDPYRAAAFPGAPVDDAPAGGFGPLGTATPVGGPGRPGRRGGPTARSGASGRWLVAAWLFPIIVVLGVLVLSSLGISGSSISSLDPKRPHDPGLLYGLPRGIRSDEWLLTSPAAIGNVRRGFPTQVWVGLTETNIPASGLGIPSRHWTEAFHPSDWAFYVAPLETGFAWRWWAPLLAGLLGVYALLVQLTRRPLVSAALAVALALSPYSAWWSLSSAPVSGYLAASAACAVYAMRRRTLLAAIVWGLLAGFFATTAGLIMYPPWLVSVGLVVLAVIVGFALDRRVGWLRFVAVAVSALVVFVPAMLQWAREALPTLTAMAGTIYPGNRISVAGGGSSRWLFDTPASLWWSGVPGIRKPLNMTGREVAANGAALFSNVSEASSTWLPLPLVLAALIAAVAGAGWSRRGRLLTAAGRGRYVVEPLDPARAPDTTQPMPAQPFDAAAPAPADPADDGQPPLRWTPALVGAVLALLLAWALLPLPAWVGDVTLLNRVPGYRTPLALGLATVILLGLGADAVQRRRPRLWFVALVVLATAASIAAMMWATLTLHWAPRQHPTVLMVTLLCVVAGLGFGLLLLGRWLSRAGAVLIALVALVIFVPVNPVYRGIGPMADDPVVKALLPYVTKGHTPRAAVYGDDVRLNALVVSTGMVSLTGLTIFPDRAYWERVDPGQESLWNNYAKYHWIPDETRDQPLIEVSAGTERMLRINPCAPSTRQLGIEYSVSAVSLEKDSCLTLIGTVTRTNGPVYIYRYTS